MTTEYFVNETITLSMGVQVLCQFVASRPTREQAEALADQLNAENAGHSKFIVEEFNY